jgi:hypothetical protein
MPHTTTTQLVQTEHDRHPVFTVFPSCPRQVLTANDLRTALALRAVTITPLLQSGDLPPIGAHLAPLWAVLDIASAGQGKAVMAWLSGGWELSDAFALALLCWAMPHSLDHCPEWCGRTDDTWHGHPALAAECKAVLAEIEKGESNG